MSNNVLVDIVNRTNGEFYIGVVGSVRSGKSTFIKRFIQTKVVPYVTDINTKNKIIDELPHTAKGKQIMTVEPKFIPNNTVSVTIDDNVTMNIRLVDSVGYVIPNALGHYTEEGPRMVKTPWFEDAIPFQEAAEIGTRKVIENHSNLGIMVTTDGSIGDFGREDYVANEERIVKELKELNKPFVIVLNTIHPNSDETRDLKENLIKKYDISVVAVNVEEMNDNDIDRILRESLSEFEISELDIKVPSYISVLDNDNKYKKYLNDAIADSTSEYTKFKHVDIIRDELSKYDLFENVEITEIDPATGKTSITITFEPTLYNDIVNDILGTEINDKGDFVKLLQEFNKAKTEYDCYKDALDMVERTGYGISLPTNKDLKVEEPEIIKQGGRYGLKLKAIAPSIHMIKVDVESTFEPIIGSEHQSKELMKSIASNGANGTDIWDAEIFGRKLSDLVNDGIRSKIYKIPTQAQVKLRDTLERIVNTGSNGLIAIIL